MAVPLTLPVGVLMIYKIGQVTSPNGMRVQSPFKFASVYQVWPGGETYVYGNQSVLYDEKDIICRLTWDGTGNTYYSLIEYARLAGIDQ